MGANNESKKIKKEICLFSHATPMTKDEIDDLYLNESSMCKIIFQTNKNGNIINQSGTGFFCEINDENISFKKALFTNNHVLNKNRIKINKEIVFEYLSKIKKIKITKDRKIFTNKEFDYTCIEIFDTDKINNFFRIDKAIFDNKNILIDKEIFILQYPKGGKLSYYLGKILSIEKNVIKHSVSTMGGSSGAPLIKRYNNNLILGIHYGGDKNKEFNYATPFDIIIKNIKDQLSNNLINENNIFEYKNKINLTMGYSNHIFGPKFVKNNKDNIKLIINGKKENLVDCYNLKKGTNDIQIIITKDLTNLEYMFYECETLENLEGLKYLNTKKVKNFSYMFFGCGKLSNIYGLQNWDVSKGENFEWMFCGCYSLSDINPLKNWDVSNVKNFYCMFLQCSSLSEINALYNWDVSNGIIFNAMFKQCTLSDLNALQNWNVSNGISFSSMFYGCSLLSDINALQNWNVSNGRHFNWMFNRCSSLSNIIALKNWNVSNGKNFEGMFYGCSSLLDINALQNWNVSDKKYFSDMLKYFDMIVKK